MEEKNTTMMWQGNIGETYLGLRETIQGNEHGRLPITNHYLELSKCWRHGLNVCAPSPQFHVEALTHNVEMGPWEGIRAR